MSLILRNLFKQLSVRSALKPPVISTGPRHFMSSKPVPYEIVDPNEKKLLNQDIINKVNSQIANNEQGRLFAVVHISGKQFKITEGDIIIVEGYWPPTAGDKIKLEKTMLVGSKDFTLIGTPLLQDGLVDIYATVIEKTLSHTKTNFKKKRRKQYTNINFYRVQQTMLRINQIVIKGTVDSPPDVTGLEHCIL